MSSLEIPVCCQLCLQLLTEVKLTKGPFKLLEEGMPVWLRRSCLMCKTVTLCQVPKCSQSIKDWSSLSQLLWEILLAKKPVKDQGKCFIAAA